MVVFAIREGFSMKPTYLNLTYLIPLKLCTLIPQKGPTPHSMPAFAREAQNFPDIIVNSNRYLVKNCWVP